MFGLAAALFMLLPTTVDAKVPRAYAGIVVDAKTGKVLYSSGADELRYPASVTKVMTLYILFQELSAGNIKLTDKMTVSKHAASAPPTKLGLKAGSTITVENAIKALVTLSANDMARVIAEYIGGTESNFAARMTKTARALGMSKTTYGNASGLPDSRQVTTVRDQARLGVAIFEHFPKYYAYFQTRSFSYGKRTYGNHNNLLGSNGVDGIKTGYTSASGYNLLTAARKDGKHIVVAGFGFAKAGSRDAKVRDLVKDYLPKAKSGDYLEVAQIPAPGRKGSVAATADDQPVRVASSPGVFPMPMPSFMTVDQGEDSATPEIGVGDVDTTDVDVAELDTTTDLGVETAPVAIAAAPAPMPMPAPTPATRPLVTDVIGAWLSGSTTQLGAPPAALGFTAPSAPLLPPVGVGEDGQPIDLLTSGSVPKVEVASIEATQAIPAALPKGSWIVQIGAAPTEAGAKSLLSGATGKVGALDGFNAFVERFEKGGQTYFRARFGGFGGQQEANDMCKLLQKQKLSCLAMQG